MPINEAATWILDAERSDLIGYWFDGRVTACLSSRDQAQAIIYGGVQDAVMPSDLVVQLDRLREQVRFNCLLAVRMAEKRKGNLPTAGAELLQKAIDRSLGVLSECAAEVDELHAFASTLKEQCRGFAIHPSSG